MTTWQRWAFNASSAAMVATGIAYFVMKDLMTSDNPLALTNHPLQPLMLSLHVLAAPVILLIFGIVFESHIAPKIRSGIRFNRRTGLVALATFFVMAASGYLLQVVTEPALLNVTRITHLLAGAIFAVSYVAHLVIGLRTGPERWAAPALLLLLLVLLPVGRSFSFVQGLASDHEAKASSHRHQAKASSHEYVSRQAYVMGTLATLTTVSDTRAAGLETLETMLGAIERTERELSTWTDDTLLARLNASPLGEPIRVDRQTCDLLTTVWQWQHDTDGAFDPAIAPLMRAYNFRGGGRQPSPPELRGALRKSGLDGLRFEAAECRFTRIVDVGLEEGAFGKGEALDRVRAIAADGSWMIDLGGQVAVQGRPIEGDGWRVAIADPRDREQEIFSVRLTGGSLSTSGGSERDVFVGGRRIGHILDPRTGRPATFGGSVLVWHERALVADILSTALFVMGPAEGVAWADARGIAACFIEPAGTVPTKVLSQQFRRRFAHGGSDDDSSRQFHPCEQPSLEPSR